MNRNWIEKILLFILFIIALPFILAIYGFIILIYIIVFPFEGIFYFKSRYYKEFKEKYFTLITFTKAYENYQLISKEGIYSEISLNEQVFKSIVSNDTLLVIINKEVTYDEESKELKYDNLVLDNNLINDFSIINYYVSKELIDKKDYKEIKKIKNIFIYSK